jgi:peptidoglycan hydrolase-like protein with peptidoglycan-binding domain
MNLQGRDLKLGLTGDDVRLLHDELAQIGFSILDPERKKTLFGPQTQTAVMKLQRGHKLRTSGIVDEATAKVINQLVAAETSTSSSGVSSTIADPQQSTPGAPSANNFLVYGRVYADQRAGIGALSLQVVDKNAGPDVFLAQGLSDQQGRYSIAYPTAPVVKAGKTAPDIQVQVFMNQVQVAASAVRYNAGPAETLDITLSDVAAARLPSEFESLTADISAHYKGQLGQLQETDKRSDITYLANKTGWDARAVALAALADQFGQNSKIPSVYFYALFRAGLPANEDSLYRVDAGTLTTIWKRANEQGIIPQKSVETISEVLKQFQAISGQRLLTVPVIAGTSAFKDMLATVKLSDAQQQQFAQLYTGNRTDMPTFWKSVTATLGASLSNRLQVAGKLALLTINNAPLMQAVNTAIDPAVGVSDPVQMVAAGYHRSSRWARIMTENIPIPAQIPGDTVEEKRANYADYMAVQLRVGYPTAAIAEMVNAGDLPVNGPEKVSAFLTANQGKFEISTQPIEQYIAKNNLQVETTVVQEIKKLQRVHQITPTDSAMSVLLKRGIDSAYRIAQYDRKAFLTTFGADLGTSSDALEIYNKAIQIHGTVLNTAISYLTAKNGIGLGNLPLSSQQVVLEMAVNEPPNKNGQVLDPEPTGPTADNASDVIAYATLESLFGSMDFCSCEECRSILSPAAYLVDLLLFIDKAAEGKENAQSVFLERRPDVQYLPLTCENTNTPMPYIDVVNETLEYYISNSVQPLSLQQYQGHDTNGTATEDLMASPQFVMDAAYTTLLGELFPLVLPFHQPLENLRLCFNKFDVPLQLAMERFRKTDDLERGGNPYGWRDILMEELGLSREEYRILTDGTLTLKQIYGFGAADTDTTVLNTLSNAKAFARRLGISYDDLIAILKTRFINPNVNLIPKLEKLNVGFGAMQALHDGVLNPADFLNLLPTGSGAPDPAEYGGDIVAWITDAANYARIMGIITLTDPTNATVGCNFENLELRYSKPVLNAADVSTRLGITEFTRLLRFIRLWHKTGWTIDQTDAAVVSLFRQDLGPLQSTDIDSVPKIDTGFLTLLPRLGNLSRTMKSLGLSVNRDLYSLLASWSNISTAGDNSLYRQMFLNAAVLKQDSAFGDNGYGEFLTDVTAKLNAHAEALRGAFNLSGDELDLIRTALAFDDNTALNLANISAIYRRGWLARKLKISVRELLLLISLTALDPFSAPDVGSTPLPESAMSRLIALVQMLKNRSMKSAVALYLVWNQDFSGKSAPDPGQVTEFARTLRGDFASVDEQFAAVEDPNGDILRARMTLVYGQITSDAFFALLDNTITTDAIYTTTVLSADATAIDSQLTYDTFRHLLLQTGLLSSSTRDALKLVAGATPDFKNAVDVLYAKGQDALGSFFSRYPELKPLYDAYVASTDPPEKKRSALLAAFQPELARLRKREQALQRLSSGTSLDLDSTRALMDPPAAPFPLHAQDHPDQPVLNDVVAVGTMGLTGSFFYRDTATNPLDLTDASAANLDYSPTNGNPLPENPTPGSAISGVWEGFVETPDTGYYNLVIETDTGAAVTLNFDATAQPLVQNGTIWRNSNPLQLRAGKLYPIRIVVEKVTDLLTVSWETPSRPREVIPGRYLYSDTILPPFSSAYVRLFKIASLISGLNLTANEIAHFAIDPDYFINAEGWLNTFAVAGDPSPTTASALLKPFLALLNYSRIKSALAIDDERLLTALDDPAAATASASALLFSLTLWDSTSLNDILVRFGSNIDGLAHFGVFQRVYDAFCVIQSIGISAGKLILATTNEPTAGIVRDFQAALRARYDASDWRDIIKPINNSTRALQRDALVSYILHQMTSNPATSQIDTPDKLYEYFLMDVQMEPCMQTSRIRHALSSIQLFIERCLMNLEPRVSPASINADYWKWMKRYRVWEANRKVFLFPENWLEPELRDDKSPFFKEIESQLLQNDITDEMAETAMLNYLANLQEVAKLEVCGVYLDEKGAGPEDDVVHVVARTSGAHRHYYYRRFELGYWTAWEKIKLDIEDTPVVPMVWQGRLLLFWVRVMKKGPDGVTTPPVTNNPSTKLVELDTSVIPSGNTPVSVGFVLCWSEYYNGKWQAVKTSDSNHPAWMEISSTAQGSNAFDRSKLRIWFRVETDNTLWVSLRIANYGADFHLYNTHSLPVVDTPLFFLPLAARLLNHGNAHGNGDFTNDYYTLTSPAIDVSRTVLKPAIQFDITEEPTFQLSDPFDAPFLYEDSRNVFYVTTERKKVWVPGYGGFGAGVNPGIYKVSNIPPLVVQTASTLPKYWGDGGPVGPELGVVDPAPMRQFITEDAYIQRGLATTATVSFGNRQIGPSGAISQKSVVEE